MSVCVSGGRWREVHVSSGLCLSFSWPDSCTELQRGNSSSASECCWYHERWVRCLSFFAVIRSHRCTQHKMRPAVADVARSVCVSVSVCWMQLWALKCRSEWTDRHPIWVCRVGPKNNVIGGVLDPPTGRGTLGGNQDLLTVPHCRTVADGCLFSIGAPEVWNSLLIEIRNCETL